MSRIMVSFSCVPVGTKDTSLSSYVAAGLKELKKQEDITYEIGPMSTVIEGDDLSEIFDVIEDVEQAIVDKGAKRVVTHIEIDDRLDKPERKSADKVKTVKEKLEPHG